MRLLLGWFLRNPLSQILKATISNFHTPISQKKFPHSNFPKKISTLHNPSISLPQIQTQPSKNQTLLRGVEMDIEQKQEELIDHFVKQASSLSGSALASVVAEATSHPSLFAFSEILAVPNVLQLEGTENSVYLDVLRLFAHGTWSDYKSNAGHLPQLAPDQALKLRQLTLLTLAETNKVLPYDQLMQELDVANVRELEDFLINECMYAGIVRGKLDQLKKCFEVQFAAGRDPRPEQLGSMIQTLSNWLVTSDNLLISIQEKMSWADKMTELNRQHKMEIEDKVEEVKRSYSLKADSDFRGHEEIYSESGGVMDYEKDRSRPKRRRHPIYR